MWPRPILVLAALLAMWGGGAACRASGIQVLDTGMPRLLASGHSAVRFRPDDHGGLRALREVYAARDRLLWVVDGRPTQAALALVQTLQQARAYGLEPQDYDADGLAALAAGMTGASRAFAIGSG